MATADLDGYFGIRFLLHSIGIAHYIHHHHHHDPHSHIRYLVHLSFIINIKGRFLNFESPNHSNIILIFELRVCSVCVCYLNHLNLKVLINTSYCLRAQLFKAFGHAYTVGIIGNVLMIMIIIDSFDFYISHRTR